MTHPRLFFLVLSLLQFSCPAVADLDAIDWLSVDYVINPPSNVQSATRDAQAAIVRSAHQWSSRGTFSVASGDVNAPSGDPNDYLSWAPYHWPDCNWCSKRGGNHLAHSGDNDDDTAPQGDAPTRVPPSNENGDIQYNRRQAAFEMSSSHRTRMVRARRDLLGHSLDLNNLLGSGNPLEGLTGNTLGGITGESLDTAPGGVLGGLSGEPLSGFVEHSGSKDSSDDLGKIMAAQQAHQALLVLPQKAPSLEATNTLPLSLTTPTTMETAMTSTHRPTRTIAPARHASKDEKCTPSPTKPMPPSTTWTTCPYVRRDGKVNPDVRTLPGVGAIQHVSDAIRHNAIAYALAQDEDYAKQAVRFVKAFFIDSKTGMNPNVDFGQIVRGPGPKGLQGTWTGILDLRGLVKVLNGISILKAAGSSIWTNSVDHAMDEWMSQYAIWLTTSRLGKEVASRGNNHVTFYVAQVAAARYYSGDQHGAAAVLQDFFDNAFQDQIAKTGEQPFEAARTRPQHYRAFNLEALITNAKLGDQVGKNFWDTESKYGATIQDAVDFAMRKPFDGEDPTDLTPHVAVVAAQYGDPSGKYGAFLRKYQSNYSSQPYWFYDQVAALKNSRRQKKRDGIVGWAKDEVKGLPKEDIPFECPKVFEVLGPNVPLDLDLFITCAELKVFYESV